jgi:response regulator RpfG family c-di-GMP phosphodiesterase
MDCAGSDKFETFNVLVVDDEASIRELLQEIIQREGYFCEVAPDGMEALAKIREQFFDVVITDITMPKLNGLDLTQKIKKSFDIDVIIMTGFVQDFSYINVIEKGASDFIQKPIVIKELMLRLRRVIRERRILAERNQALIKMQDSVKGFQRAMNGIIYAMESTIETRDPYTAGHQRRVADLSKAIGHEMGLSSDALEGLFMAAVIHDLGKIAMPAEILSKPGKLNDIEYAMIKTHPAVGFEILKTIEFPWPLAKITVQHHERMNGSGYPEKIPGDQILVESRILAVADVVEAMASHRPYRAALGVEAALKEIEKNKKVLYDPEVVEACIKILMEQSFDFEER